MGKKSIFLSLGDQTSTEVTLNIDIGACSKIALVNKSRREWRGNVTEDLINRLFFPILTNNVEFVTILVDGRPGSGKTTKVKRIVELLVQTIKESGYQYNLMPVRSIKQVAAYFDNADYQIAIIDDASRYDDKLARIAAANLDEIRHIFQEKAERKSGVLIIFWIIQDSFVLPKRIRKYIPVSIYNSCPGSEYDINYIDRITCGKGIDLLTNWETKIYDEHRIEFKSRCIVSTPSWAGYAVFDLPKTDELKNLEFINPSESESTEDESYISMNYYDGEYIFKEKERVDLLDELIVALQNHDKILREREISTKLLKPKYVEAYIQYLQGWTYDNIAEYHNVTPQALSNSYENKGWFAIVREEIIGHILEYVLVQDGNYYSGYEIIAGNGRIDLLSPDKQKAIEVKCRHRYEKPSKSMICAEMHKILSESKKTCELALCIVRKKTAQCRIYEIFKHDKQDKDSNVESSSSHFTTSPLSSSSSSSFSSSHSAEVPPKTKSHSGLAKEGVVKHRHAKSKNQ